MIYTSGDQNSKVKLMVIKDYKQFILEDYDKSYYIRIKDGVTTIVIDKSRFNIDTIDEITDNLVDVISGDTLKVSLRLLSRAILDKLRRRR